MVSSPFPYTYSCLSSLRLGLLLAGQPWASIAVITYVTR